MGETRDGETSVSLMSVDTNVTEIPNEKSLKEKEVLGRESQSGHIGHHNPKRPKRKRTGHLKINVCGLSRWLWPNDATATRLGWFDHQGCYC